MSLDISLVASHGEVFTANITHNLNTMADHMAATDSLTLYDVLWRPDKNGIETGAQLADALAGAVDGLIKRRKELEAYNPPNGWGNYETLRGFVLDVLSAAYQHPNAKVEVWR